MAYLKPPWFTRKVFNPLAMKTGMSGTKELAVTKRRTGGTLKVPVIPLERDGARYLVSTRGESDWVRNLRASGNAVFDGEPVSATELTVEERGPILDAYKAKLGRTVAGYFRELPDPADHPVFRLEPR